MSKLVGSSVLVPALRGLHDMTTKSRCRSIGQAVHSLEHKLDADAVLTESKLVTEH